MARVEIISRWLATAMLAAALWPATAWALSTPLKAVSFSNTTQGYIVGGDNSHNGVISWTSNGGDSWHAKIQPNRFMGGVCASVDGGTAVPSTGDENRLSSDSGITWTTQTPVLSRIVAYSDIAYLAGGRRVLVGKLASSNPIALIASSVGSAPWNIDFQGPVYSDSGGNPDYSLTLATLSSVDAASGGNVAWAVGSDWSITGPGGPYKALIYKTVNGGSSWAAQTLGTTGPVLNCVAVVDTQTAFIGRANRTLLRTLHGSAWTGIDMGYATGIASVNGIDALDADHVLVAGNTINNAGRIAWTSNGSATTPVWTVATAPSTLLSVQMLDATHWIVVGDDETILRTANGGVTWTGPTSPTIPSAAITSPASANLLGSNVISIQGTSTDGLGIGVANVEVRVQRGDGQYWNGSSWAVSSNTWLPAIQDATANGWDAWHETVTLPDISSVGALTVSARATDGLGNASLASVSTIPESNIALSTHSASSPAYGSTFKIGGTLKSGSVGTPGQTVILQSYVPGGSYRDTANQVTGAGGTFSFSVKPYTKTWYRVRFAGSSQYRASGPTASVYARPRVYVRTPIAPSTMRRTRYYTIYGWLKPRHTARTYPVRIYKWRYVSHKWKSYGYMNAKASNYSSYTKYSRSMRLPYAGKWRVRAYAPADSGHAATWSSGYDYVAVR